MNRKLSLSLIALAAMGVAVQAQRTTRGGLVPRQPSQTVSSQSVATDTIAAPEPHTVDINGYDKPLRSRREVFFATNNSSRGIEALAFTINYYDTKNRQLHKASHNVNVDIPAGETRQVSVRSWDSQCNFYYIHSAVPQRVEKATAYRVTIAVDTLFVR
ncbi:MAG: FxLYD domain-containing protein [Muribaculaceae bacterium]|nr:FxLYD domain-containing protein [Muribaculaceae bacterium]